MPLRIAKPIAFSLPTSFFVGATAVAEIRCVKQDQGNWCWAACIQMILADSRPMQQWEIVNTGLGRNDCEAKAATDCNIPILASGSGRSIVSTLALLGQNSTPRVGPLTPDGLRNAVARTPVIAAYDASAAGHVVVVSACDLGSPPSNPMFWISDPGTAPFQSAWKSYDQLLFGFDLGIGTWSSTITDIGA